jgi:hypothetical protein
MVLSLGGLCLGLLGFGYALAVETLFGVQESLFADGGLDYVRLSSHVIAYAITRIAKDFSSVAFYVRLCAEFWPHLAGATLVWVAALFISRSKGLRRSLPTSPDASENALFRIAGLQMAGHWFKRWSWPMASLLGIWAAIPVLAWLLMLVGGLLVALVAFVPLVGYTLGIESLQALVVDPEGCVGPRTREERMLPRLEPSSRTAANNRGAVCVTILEQGTKAAVQGRLVVATAKWAVLFDPASGLVRRVPVQNAEITPVASLSAPEVPSSTASKPAISDPSVAPPKEGSPRRR